MKIIFRYNSNIEKLFRFNNALKYYKIWIILKKFINFLINN